MRLNNGNTGRLRNAVGKSRLAQIGYFDVSNFITNGNFSNSTTGYGTLACVLTESENVGIATGDGSFFTIAINQITTQALNISHIYYMRLKVTIKDLGCVSFYVQYDGSTAGTNKTVYTKLTPTQNNEYDVSIRDTLPANATGTVRFIINAEYANAGAASGKIMEVQYISLINLTAHFGAGIEPSIDEMDLLMQKWENQYLNGTETISTQEWINIQAAV